MTNHVYLVFIFDMVYYPPVLSIIRVLLDLGVKVSYVGPYSDTQQKEKLERLGCEFVTPYQYNPQANIISKYIGQNRFKRDVLTYFENKKVGENDLIWIMNSETMSFVYPLVFKYKTILQFFEFTESYYNWKYKVASPGYNQRKTMHAAYKVVHCEYNRAMITKGLYGLEMPPIVLPNKPYEFDNVNIEMTQDVSKLIQSVSDRIQGKKVILYQGIFDSKERRLEEFCLAMNQLSEDYLFLAMGKGDADYDALKSRFSSDRIIFIPFIKPPFHMEVTRLATLGVLSYFPVSENYADVINPIYCAPNKIFEYAKYGIPMISNDIPGLHYIYKEFRCGEAVEYPMAPESIAKTIEKICDNIDAYRQGAKDYYDSVNIEAIVKQIIS